MSTGKKHKLSVAVVQNAAGEDVARNLARIEKLLLRVGRADLVALPEVFAYRGPDSGYRLVAEPLDGPVCSTVGDWARRMRAWVLAGSVIERCGNRVYNTSVLFDRSGLMRASYRKIHLFEARLEDGAFIREADAYSPGRSPATAVVDGWRAGFSICYDLRFPELYRRYSKAGASLLLAPSNFTQRTGRDHWEVLVRARAIENQCFVVAPNQCGTNPGTGVKSHGHSMIVGPWGEVLATAGDREGVIRAELSVSELKSVRMRVPALAHRVL